MNQTHASLSPNRFVHSLRLTALSLVLGLPGLPRAVAQTPATPQSPPPETASPLVEGLLDLLNEPKSNNSPTVPPKLQPQDVGLAEEELGESTNPLESIRQSMFIAAGYLRQGAANSETEQLQADIVGRLDELIAELEKSNAANKSSSPPTPTSGDPAGGEEQPSASDTTSAQSPSTPSNQKADDTSDSAAPEGQDNPGGGQQQTPGGTGSEANPTVDLLDPRALQQSVWGQLPERMRKQMQSRMVERFLPSYREQIEAYFQALLESQ